MAQAEGVNSHQVFDWRRAYRNGKLAAKGQKSAALLPVVVSAADARRRYRGCGRNGAAFHQPIARDAGRLDPY